MRNLREREALRRAETQKWLNRLKPFFSDEPNISRFDVSWAADAAKSGAAQFFKVADRTSQRWALGESEIPEAVAMLLRLMIRLRGTSNNARFRRFLP